ncbi:MAG: gliding motility lipoprotein GldD [Mucilaginibacter polytrichastri]|nr:gliding motility lipoprotein GldD [Mucilaginibacter polytrichastri]
MRAGGAVFTLIFLALLSFAACSQPDFSPKPRGFYRIEFPKKAYRDYGAGCPFTFRYPVYGVISPDKNPNARACWLNLDFPQFKGSLHISYYPVTSKSEFNQLTEDARTFVFKHTVKATAIDEGRITYPDRKLYGIYYTINGNAASSVQFFVTDSTRHYLRGALYFNEEPRLDSIQPVLDFVKADIDTLIRSFRWK